MTNKIAFVVDGKNLTALTRESFATEDLFQSLLADHPDVLAPAAGATGRLLIVKREQPVPDELEGMGRWSLDQLFLDGEGVPVLVEVKRASDTRLRREVVAQMLDYAANGVAYWPVDALAPALTRTSEAPDEGRLRQFLGREEPETFWRRVDQRESAPDRATWGSSSRRWSASQSKRRAIQRCGRT